MPLQSWDIVVQGQPHRVELDRNAESGKHFLRVDGRIAMKPFSEERGEFPVEISGRPFLLRVAPGSYALDDKGSRYVDPNAQRPSAGIGRVTICRGLEQMTIVTDGALLRVNKLADGMKRGLMVSSGGGVLGALVGGAVIAGAERLQNKLGSTNREQPIRSFDELQGEVTCRLEHLPLDLVSLLSDELELDTRVFVVPRRAMAGIDAAGRNKISVRTVRSNEKAETFDCGAQSAEALEHLYSAAYPLSPELTSKIGQERLAQLGEARQVAATFVAPPPPAAAAPVAQRTGGLPQVRRAAPLVTGIGMDAAQLAFAESDAEAFRATYSKTAIRKLKFSEVLEQLKRDRFDIVHVLGTYDDKTRFRDAAGAPISLQDVIRQLAERGARLIWIAGGNDATSAEPALKWAASLNLLVVLTTVRGDDHSAVLGEALAKLAAGEPLSVTLPELETRSQCRFRLAGRGEAIFLAG